MGSSQRRSRGRLTTARAMATRCLSPPESVRGNAAARPRRPTRSSTSRASRRPSVFGRPGEEERQRDVLLGRELGKEMVELEHESHARAAHGRARGRRERGPVRAVERHAARVGRVEPGEKVEQRRLSAARRAGDREEIARADGERNAAEDLDPRLAGPEPLREALRDEQRRRSQAPRRASTAGWRAAVRAGTVATTNAHRIDSAATAHDVERVHAERRVAHPVELRGERDEAEPLEQDGGRDAEEDARERAGHPHAAPRGPKDLLHGPRRRPENREDGGVPRARRGEDRRRRREVQARHDHDQEDGREEDEALEPQREDESAVLLFPRRRRRRKARARPPRPRRRPSRFDGSFRKTS